MKEAPLTAPLEPLGFIALLLYLPVYDEQVLMTGQTIYLRATSSSRAMKTKSPICSLNFLREEVGRRDFCFNFSALET